MAPKNAILWTTLPEYIGLVKFLIERTKDVKSPLSISLLAREFKEMSKSSLSESGLEARIGTFCSIVHEMEHIDTATKVKLLFALRAPIDRYFLEYLQTRAEVILDDYWRIIKYRKYGGGLELGRTHIIRNGWVKDNGKYQFKLSAETIRIENISRDKRMIEFLAQIAMETDTPITNISFAREFKEITEATDNINSLTKRYNLLKNKIHESTDFDQRTKIRMIFVSSARVPNSFLETLRKDALVEVDESNRITNYTAYDGSLKLQGEHSFSAKSRAGKIETIGKIKESYSRQIKNYFENKEEKNEEMGNLIQFITEKCENADSPLSTWELTKEFNSSGRTFESLDTSYQRMIAYRHEIQSMKYLDTPTKVKQLFVLSVSLNLKFLERLRKKAMVEVDNQNRITKYLANDGSLKIPRDHIQSIQMKERLVEIRKNRNHGDDHIDIDNSSKRIKHSESDRWENCYSNFNDFDEPEVKLEPFRGSLIDDFVPIDPDEDVKAIPPSDLRETKNEIKEEQIDVDTMEFPIKTEEDDFIDFIISKEEELEEEDIKPEFPI